MTLALDTTATASVLAVGSLGNAQFQRALRPPAIMASM
jgi:hypothetical protein